MVEIGWDAWLRRGRGIAMRRWGCRLTAACFLLVGALTTVPEARIGALDEEWSNSISSNATNETANTETILLHYPVIGDAYPGSFYGGLHQDTSFCSPRSYTNLRCVSPGTGHEVVPASVEFEVAVPRLRPAGW
jgi:hypothetical protein